MRDFEILKLRRTVAAKCCANTCGEFFKAFYISENIKILYSEKYNEAGRPPAFKGRSARRFFTAFFAAMWVPLFKVSWRGRATRGRG